MKKTLTCIECPVGCQVTVETEDGKILSVTGNACPRGKVYAENEVVCPRRIVTTTARAEDGKMIPVKTNRAVKKDEIFAVMERIKKLSIRLPVEVGDVVYKEIAEGCDLVATRAFDKEKR
ncbi:MAG: DUF1667 domain-containing protein [Clostridia bacterium]|nr:DUF1667 domain-containing protein [Clostridia bacterium]